MKPHRILVVEDEESLAVGLEYALSREGFEVVLARDGAAASECLRREAFDLLLLDVMLPRKSGFDILASLRREGRELPVILLTAKNQEIDKVHGFDLGADDYVTKPFSLVELLARVKARLRSRTDSSLDCPATLEIGPARVDLRALRATLDGRVSELSLREVTRLRCSRSVEIHSSSNRPSPTQTTAPTIATRSPTPIFRSISSRIVVPPSSTRTPRAPSSS